MDDCIIDALAVVIEADAADARRINGIDQFNLLSGDPGKFRRQLLFLDARQRNSSHNRYRHNAMIFIIELAKNLYTIAELTDIALFHQNLEEIEQIRFCLAQFPKTAVTLHV